MCHAFFSVATLHSWILAMMQLQKTPSRTCWASSTKGSQIILKWTTTSKTATTTNSLMAIYLTCKINSNCNRTFTMKIIIVILQTKLSSLRSIRIQTMASTWQVRVSWRMTAKVAKIILTWMLPPATRRWHRSQLDRITTVNSNKRKIYLKIYFKNKCTRN